MADFDLQSVQEANKVEHRAGRNSSIDNNGQFALTTIDNPYDPFTQYSDWLMYDITNGYNSNAYLARIAHTSERLSEQENEEE